GEVGGNVLGGRAGRAAWPGWPGRAARPGRDGWAARATGPGRAAGPRRTAGPGRRPDWAGPASVEVEHLGQLPVEARRGIRERVDQHAHRRLPAGVHLAGGEVRLEALQVLDLEIAEQPVAVDEDRVVAGARRPELVEHLGPDRGVAPA